jgi:basic amino acid/polyamine antiporter, APA family
MSSMSSMNWLRLKPVEFQKEDTEGARPRVLGLLQLTLFGAANVIGAGIFMKTGSINASTGPAAVLSFMLAGLVCALTGICYARFSSQISSSGSAFTYIYSSLGEVAAFLSALGLFAETSLSCAALVQTCTDNIRGFFNMSDSSFPISIYYLFPNNEAWFFLDRIDLMSPILVVLITMICLIGLKESATFGSIVTCVNCLMILTIIGAGFSKTDVQNFENFMPSGVPSVLKTVPDAFFAYIGWDAACSMSEETLNPKRNVPRGIFGTLILVGTLYCGVSLSVSAFASNAVLKTVFTSPTVTIAEVFKLQASYKWVYNLIRICIMFTTANAALASAQGQPRVFFRMAQDGLLPKKLGSTDKRGVAVFGVLVTGVVSLIACTFFNTDGLVTVVTVSILIMQCLVSVGALAFQRESKIPVSVKCLLAVLGVLAVFTGAATQVNAAGKVWAIMGMVSGGLAAVLGATVLFLLKNVKKDFVPVLAMTMNLFFAGSMGFLILAQILAFYAAMLAVYYGYGRKHSVLACQTLNTPHE